MKILKYVNLIVLIIFLQSVTAKEQIDYQKEFEKVLQQIQNFSIRNDNTPPIDWEIYRSSLNISKIQSDIDFFQTLETALNKLDDSHSFVMPPYATKAIKEDPTIVNKQKPSVTVKNGIGIITMPGYYPIDPSDYFSPQWVKNFHQKILVNKNSVTKGWIIDLTENDGGNIYPMLGALNAFFQNKNVGGYYLISENRRPSIQAVTVENGILKIADQSFQYPSMKTTKLPIAVLIGPKTASSGEFLALALKRQPYAKLFGQPSYGIATANVQMKLPEAIGGFYMLTMGYFLDANDQPLRSARVMPEITCNGTHKELITLATKYIEKHNQDPGTK